MNKNNKPIIAAIIIVALLIIIGAVFASGILAHDDDEQAAYEVNFIDGEQVIKTITVKENHLVTRINDPVKEGYIFAGWYTDQELTNEFTFDDTYITNDLTLYAKWVKASEPEPGDITYTVTFNTNGANSISPQIVKAGDKAVKPADPLKSGYKFVGWYSDSSFTTLFDFQSPITFDITLYAKFTSTGGGGGGGSVTPPVTPGQTFTVEFISDEILVGSQTIKQGDVVSEPTAPIKEGYTFAGWYAEGSSIKFDFNTPINENLTLYAKWSIEYTTSGSQATVELSTDSNTAQEQIEQLVSNGKIELVNTSANEEVNEVVISSEVLGQVQTVNNSAKDVVVTTAQGSIALSSNVVGQLISTAQSSTNDSQDTEISITIIADEKPNTYQITIATNDDKPVTRFSEPIVISIPYTIREGENPQDIAVYYIDENEKETLVHGTYSEETKCVDITTDHLSTYEIKNTAQYAVVFDSNGGTLSIEDLSKYSKREFGSPIEKPADPIRAGYNFVDWFKDKDCTQAWNFNSDTVRGESYEITLYAKWEIKLYAVEYNLDGGVNNPNNPASYNIESDTITLQSPTKTGHTFLGWFDKDDHKVTSIVKGSTGSLQLTAKWEIKQYTVTLASGENYTLTPLAKSASTVNHGDDFSFTLNADNSLNLAVKANGQTITPANGIYTITNITEDQIVTVEGVSAETYEAIFANSTGIYDVDNTDAINKGADYTFTISLNDAYSQSEPTLQIFGTYASVNKNSQSGNDYTYTISKVESDLVILVNGLQKNTYAVTFISNSEEILKQNVTHGESASLISNLTRPGYEFKGWFLDEEGTNQYTNQPITADTTLYAFWSAGSSNYFIYIYQEKIQHSEANKYELIKVEQISETIGTTVSIDPSVYQTDEILFDRDGFKLNDEMSNIEGKVASESPLVLSLYFDRKEFTITFLAQDGSSLVTDKSDVAQITAKYGQPVYPVRVVLPNNTILDYWHEANTDTPYLFSTMPAKDLDLYAKYLNVYTLSYDANGGTGEIPFAVQYQEGTEVILFGPGYPTEGSYLLTKEGYTFGGWEYDGVVYHPGDKLTIPNADVKLFAKWKPVSYTITFESNGGSAVAAINADYGTKITKPDDPKRDGYTFDGWFKDVKLTQAWNFAADTVPVNGTTLYAKWTADEHTITFESNGGSTVDSIVADYGTIISKPADPIRAGYTFVGWFKEEALQTEYSFSTMPAEDFTLYAKWDINTYQVTFHPNNNSKEYTANVIFEELVPSQDVSKKGYTLEGWYTDINLTNNWDFTTDTMPAENIDLYAKWTLDTYTLKFYNGDELFKSIKYTIETESMDLPEFSQEGYTFTGWFEKGSSTEFFYSPGVTIGDKELYANLKINHYTITFDSNGGSNAGSITQDYDSTLGPLPKPTYDGHKFLGWFEDNETFNIEFTATTMPAKDITLYAKWEPNKYTLTINYLDESGSQVYAQYNELIAYAQEYRITSPVVDELLPDLPIVQGIMPDHNLSIIVTYGDYLASVNGNNFRTIEEAISSAQEGDRVILLRDYVLQNNLIIPQGITLVLPCGDTDQGYDLTVDYEVEHNPDGEMKDNGDHSQLYRTLTVPKNVTIDLQGQLLVNAVTGRADGGYRVMDITGGYAQILLEGNIIVKNGGILEVCGYVTGNGQITAEAGAEVRDMYIVQHWRGGSQALQIYNGDRYHKTDLFPFTEYNCHNIQSTLCMYSGSSLFGNVKMYETMISGYHYTRFPQVDNDNGLIRLADGAYLIRNHDADAPNGSSANDVGRTTYEFYGGATFSHSTLWIVQQDLSTKDYLYPLDGDISFEMYDGEYLLEDSFKVMTGAQISLHENATLTINANKRLIIYDEFHDLKNVPGTEYPDRPAATLTLYDGSIFNINGSFAGILNFEESGNAVVNVAEDSSLQLNTSEINGYVVNYNYRDPIIFRTLHFETKYQYTISFNSNEGSEQSPIKYFAGDEIELPTPERLGYNFQGWYLDTALTQLCNPDDITSGNITLYAKWDVSKYTVSFASNGGSSVADQIINHNEAAEKPNDPTRSGFKFIAWYADQELTEVYDFTTPVTGKTTLYAKWEAIEYTISFVTNNEETLEAVKYTTADNSLAIKELSKTGYDFQGWYLDEDLTSPFTFKQYETVGNLTLYAKWSPTAYTIKYYDGIQLNLAPNSYSIEETVTLPTPEKTGYVFAGWHEKSDLSDEAVFTISKGTSGNKSYYASWTAESFAITYFDGSNALSLSPATYTILENVVLPTPAKDGYTFSGWYNNADCTGNKITSIPIGSSGAKVFYAKFTINQYTISFNSNGGSAVGNITADYGTSIDEPTAPTMTGYNFAGWFKDAEFTQAWDFAADTVPVNGTTLYAKWTLEIYTIDFYKDNELVKSVEYSVESDSIEMPPVSKEGYTFDDWYLAAASKPFEYIKGTTIGDFDLHAKFDINQYTISFNSNGGTEIAAITTYYGTTLDEPTAPTRTGYTFAGWFKDADCLTAWNFEVDTVPAGDITLHAKWIANSYTVVFHANNGTADTTSQNFKYDEAQNLTANTFTKEGYTFKGWSESSGGDVKYADKVSVTNLTADNNGTINLYAVWNAQIFSVIYNNNGGEGSIENTSATYDSTVVLNNGDDFSKEGHSLTAWNTMADGSGMEYALDYKFEPWNLTDNLTLYAQWTVNSSTISFNSNGGSAVEAITANYGTTITAPTAPDKEGHTFAGWYTDDTLQNEYTFTTIPAESITLYAKWTVNQYTVTYYVDGGKYQSYDIKYGEAVTIPADPTKTGYTFKGWDAEIPASMPAENLTFNAAFDINQHTITYMIDNKKVETQTYNFGATITAYQPDNTEGKTFSGWSPELPETMPDYNITVSGSFNANTYTITYYVDGKPYDNPQSVEFGETITPMNQPTKDGYTFSGWVWYKVENGVETKLEAAPATMPAYHLVVRGSFTINTYKVTFHPNNIDKDSTVSVDYGSLIEVPSVSAKTGYTLEGWYTDDLLTNKWDFATDTMPAENIDLYANWTLDTYTINLYIGDESFKSIEYTIETGPTDLPEISQEGYTFTGWFEKGSSTEFFYSPGVTVGNIDVYAGLEINHYTITFNSNGGSNEGSVKQDYNTLLGPLPTPTYDGYKFMGWFEDNGTFSKAFTATTMPAGDITLYAKWEAISYSITYVLNGGTNNPANPTSYTVETATITLQDATKEGYTFDGWYETIDCTGSPVSEIPSQSVGDKTFYAKFTPNNYTIVFHANNGTDATTSQNFKYDETQNLTANTFTKEGCDFLGWSDSSGGDVKYADKLSVTNLTANDNGTINLYAVWQINQYTISFNSNGGSAVSAIKANYGTNIDEPTTPAKTGYIFVGWFKDIDLTQAWDFAADTVPVNGTTLYAKWDVVKYTITFESNGGSAVAAIDADYGTTITKPTDPKRDGYTFAGWFKDIKLTQAWDFAVDTVPVNGTTLYAKWTADEYTINFDSDGAGAINSITYTIGETFDLPTPGDKIGHTFIGWYNGDQEFTYEVGITIGNYNLTAHWEATNYAIIYKDGEKTISGLQPASYTYEAAKTLATNATKEGYTFAGWYDNMGLEGDAISEISAQSTGEKTFYAKWSPISYTIVFHDSKTLEYYSHLEPVFNYTSKKFSESYSEVTVNQTMQYDVHDNLIKNSFEKIYKVSTTEYSGAYTFAGWNSSSENAEKRIIEYTDEQEVWNLSSIDGAEVHLYAVWIPTVYTITYDLNGGINLGNPTEYTVESCIALSSTTNQWKTQAVSIKSNMVEYAGHTFDSWSGTYISSSNMSIITLVGSNGVPKNTLSDRSYTAHWTVNQYNISFDSNGGSVVEPISADCGTTITKPTPDPTKAGYVFGGWYKDAECIEIWNFDTDTVPAGGATLYAKWLAETNVISLPIGPVGEFNFTSAALDGYDVNNVSSGTDFKFTVTFDSSLTNCIPVINWDSHTKGPDSQDGSVYTFTIPNVTSSISVTLSITDTTKLKNLINNTVSSDYKLSFDGNWTITVSIINPNTNATNLINGLSAAISATEIPVNEQNGRSNLSTFLAYLPDDDTLWENNLADYVVEAAGYTIIFKQDAEAVEEAKIQYLTEIAQVVRLFRENSKHYPIIIGTGEGAPSHPEILSVSVGADDGAGCKYVDIGVLRTTTGDNQDIMIMTALSSNYSTVISLVGHQDAKWGFYDLASNPTGNRVQLGKDITIAADMAALYGDAKEILKRFNMPITDLDDPLRVCFDESGTGYGGYGKYYCISEENGIRYTDTYHLKFSNYFKDETKPTLHAINVTDGLVLKNFGASNELVEIPFNKNLCNLTGAQMNNELLTNNTIYNNEYNQLVKGELVVVSSSVSGSELIGLTITDVAGNDISSMIQWYDGSNTAFIMPDVDITINPIYSQ